MNILFTSVGRRVELIQAFRNAAQKTNTKLVIYGADISMDAPALVFCDKTIQICKIKDKEYIPMLLKVCEEEKIDALIPTIDTDLLVLAQNKHKFSAVGTKVFISDEDKVAICRDKRYTTDFFLQCGLTSPMTVNDYRKYDLGFPAFIKPKDGSSSINAFKVENIEDLKAKTELVDDYIIQPFVCGKEYTVDILCDFEHNPIFITPRERLSVRSGEVLQTRIIQDERIKEECRKLIAAFKPVGPITVQLIRDSVTNEDYFIEINPRFGGGAPLSIKAGADSAEAIIRLLSGEKIGYTDAAFDGSIYSRFDQSVCMNFGEKVVVKAIIFDLDDTLYNERDYVKSGYRAIEKATGVSSEKLWKAFEEGKLAIDTVLEEIGEMDIKDKCLEIYRNHKPEITLYPGVAEMIEKLKNKGIFVGIITDGRPEGQKAKIEALGLNVDKVIITDEIGGSIYRKPCDIAFRIMQRVANVDYTHMLYVGDNPAKDFIAPNQLGMQTVWYKNDNGLYRKDGKNVMLSRSTKRISDICSLLDNICFFEECNKYE